MTTISVQVFGPQLLQQALQTLLPTLPHVCVVEQGAQAALLCGPEWMQYLVLWHASLNRRGAGVVLIAPASAEELLEATRLGVSLIGIDDSPLLLMQALEAAAVEQTFCSPQLYPRIQKAFWGGAAPNPEIEGGNGVAIPKLLSEREHEVVIHALHGLTNREIGAQLHVSASTAKFHLKNAYLKLGICRRSQLHRALAAQDSELLTARS